MIGLGLFRSSQRLFPQVGAEIADQIGKVFPVERPDRLPLEGGQKPQLQAKIRFSSILNISNIGESLRCFMNFSRHDCSAIGAGQMKNRKMLPFLLFNIHPVVSSTVFSLVMDIVAVDRPVTGLLIAAAQTSEIGIVIIRCHYTHAVALGAFHLDSGGGASTVCEKVHRQFSCAPHDPLSKSLGCQPKPEWFQILCFNCQIRNALLQNRYLFQILAGALDQLQITCMADNLINAVSLLAISPEWE